MSISVYICNVGYRETLLAWDPSSQKTVFSGPLGNSIISSAALRTNFLCMCYLDKRSQKSFSPIPIGLDVVSRTEAGSTWLWQVVSLAGHWTPPHHRWNVPSTLYIFDWGTSVSSTLHRVFCWFLNQDKNCTCMFFYSDSSQLNCQKLSAILYF